MFWNASALKQNDSIPARVLVRREFLTLLTNPKAYLLLTVFLPQFVIQNESIKQQMMVLGLIYLSVETVAALVWIGFGARVGLRALTSTRRKWINRCSGTAMVLAAIGLLYNS